MHRFGVWGAPFDMAWRFSRGSYFDLAKSFPARLINRYFCAPLGRCCYFHLVGHPSGGLVLVIGRRMRWGGAPLCGGGASAQPRRGGATANLDLRTLDDR